MKKIDDSFSLGNGTDECVQISSIRTNTIIDNAIGTNKFGVNGGTKHTKANSRTHRGLFEIVNKDTLLKNMEEYSLHAHEKIKQTKQPVQKETSRPRLEQLSYFTRTLAPSNIQPSNRAEGKNYEVCCSEIDDDFQDEDTMDTMTLRNNLKAKILTETKASLFNNKIQHFNDLKNATLTHRLDYFSRKNSQPVLSETFRLPPNADLSFQGPKYSFPLDLSSPKPKDNSLDEINDMFDFSEDDCFDQPDTLDHTQKIPMKDYLEISQAFEKNNFKSPERETLNLSEQHLFSRENAIDNSDYLEILESEEGDRTINVNMLKSGSSAVKFLETEDNGINEKDGLEMLRKAIFDHNIDAVLRMIRKNPTLLNQADALGNTPLMLTAKMAYRHLDYFQIAKCLLAHGSSPKIKDTNGWSCLDEAVCQSDVMLLSILFDNLVTLKKKALEIQQEKLVSLLNLTPDFYLEMKWDFESSIIPFFSKLAPSDTFKIWKYRKYLRMDSTLAGFKRLSIKRRDMSLIFNPDIPMPSNFKASGSLYTVNRTKSQYTNALQDVDIEEKKYMMYDMLKAEPLQGTFNIKNCQWHEYKGIFGHSSMQKVNDWETKRLDFKLEMEYALFKKSKTFFKDTFDIYQSKLLNAKSIPNQDFLQKGARDILNHLKQRNGVSVSSTNKNPKNPPNQKNINQLQMEKINLETFENAQVTEKKAEASIWLARNFPMKFEALEPVIKFLSNGNNLLQRMESLLSRDEVKSLISENAFPVKIQVPVTLSIKANITITKYELIKNPNVQDLFFIPKDFTYIDRKEAQKTLLRTKKRMVLVNMLT